MVASAYTPSPFLVRETPLIVRIGGRLKRHSEQTDFPALRIADRAAWIVFKGSMDVFSDSAPRTHPVDWRAGRALQPAAARLAALSGAAAAGVGRGLLWLVLAVAFGTVELLVHVTEFGARRFSRRG